MRLHQRPLGRGADRSTAVPTLLLPFVATLLMWATTNNEVSLLGFASALVLTCVPWWSYLKWRDDGGKGAPLFSIVAAMFWVYFAFPLFWGRTLILMWSFVEVGLTTEAINRSVAIAACGVFVMWLGHRSGLGGRLVPGKALDIAEGYRGRRHLRLLLVFGIIFGFAEGSVYLLGSGGRQLILIIQTVVPLVVFAYLFRLVLRGEASQTDRILAGVFFFVKIMLGISSGWLGALVWPVTVCVVVYLEEKRRLPMFALAGMIAAFLFFQVGKQEFRTEYWNSQNSGSRLERVSFWVTSSFETWADVLSDPSGQALRRVVTNSSERVSLLSQTANVLELTPRVVPHQGWSLYSYLAVTLIPRFVWPNKPSVNESSMFYQVAYGLTQEKDLNNVSISVGYLTEGYIAFGWTGALAVMFIQGLLIHFFERLFLSPRSGMLFRSIGVVFVYYFMGIEAQAAQFLGGLVQQFVVVVAVMLPVIRVKNLRPLTRTTRGRVWAGRRLQSEY